MKLTSLILNLSNNSIIGEWIGLSLNNLVDLELDLKNNEI